MLRSNSNANLGRVYSAFHPYFLRCGAFFITALFIPFQANAAIEKVNYSYSQYYNVIGKQPHNSRVKKKHVASKAFHGQAKRFAALIVDVTSKKVLLDTSSRLPRYPASLTKLMTLYLLFDDLKHGKINLWSKVVISGHASGQSPVKVGLKIGSAITVDEAIRALTVASANDVAVAVAERLSGSEAAFAKRMNETAKKLGMYNTKFVNASGLHNSRQLTTARDMYKLSYAMIFRHHIFLPYFALRETNNNGRVFLTHDNLLGRIDGVIGLKTGYTRHSGYNLVTVANRSGHIVIGIVLGAKSREHRDKMMSLYVTTAYATSSRKRVNNHSEVFTGTPSSDWLGAIASLNSQPAVKMQVKSTQNFSQRTKNWSIIVGDRSTKKQRVHRLRERILQEEAISTQLGKPDIKKLTVNGETFWTIVYSKPDIHEAYNSCQLLRQKNYQCQVWGKL